MESNLIDNYISPSDTGSTPDIINYKGKSLTQEMHFRLQDLSLVGRYGTSMEYGTEIEYSEYLRKKYLRLKAEILKGFNSIDEYIGCGDLIKFFSLYESKTNLHLTPNYIETFYEELFIDVNMKITV